MRNILLLIIALCLISCSSTKKIEKTLSTETQKNVMDSTVLTKKTAVKIESKTDSSNTVTCEEITTEFAPVKSGGKDTSLIVKQTIKRTIKEKKGSKTQVENKETAQTDAVKHSNNESDKTKKEVKKETVTPFEENVNSNINEKIKQNNARAITGIILNGVLRNIISFVIAALGLFYTKEDINDKLEKIELTPGADGKSAYQIWLAAGNTGTEAEYIASLKGSEGKSAYQVWLDAGNTGTVAAYTATLKGADGKSAYQIWLDAGNTGTEAEYIASFKGSEGKSAYQVWLDAGNTGTVAAYTATLKGADGKSAYQVWLAAGNTGTEAEYIASLKGSEGKSAYQVWLDAGNTGTVAAYTATLKGADGKSAYQVWLDAGNSGSIATYISSLKGADGVLGSLTSLVTTATAFTLALASDALLLGISKINATLNYLNDNKLAKTLTQNKLWIGNSSNVATESDILPEWTVGASQPGQKENKGLITEMIVADSSIIQLPTIVHKPITLTAPGTIQLLSDTITGSYYVIESIVLIGRGISVSQNPIISIGCNASTYNDIAASQTLSTLANGLNVLTLTANASKALVQANTNMFLNITQALIGGGTFELVIKGYLSKI